VVLAEFGWYSGFPTCLSLFFNAVFCIFLLVLLNLVLERYRPAWALQGTEILVVFTMVSIASGLAGHDSLQTPDSDDHPFAPVRPELWPIPGNHAVCAALACCQRPDSVAGMLRRPGVDLRLAQLLAVDRAAGLVDGTHGRVVLGHVGTQPAVRKQWVENEKLAYPIIQVPMLLAVQPRVLFKNKVFWVGFGFAATIGVMNGLNVLFPLLPKMPVASVMDLHSYFPERPWSEYGEIIVSFYPFAIGMFFLIPLDLAFRAVLFCVL